ncbi:MAG TPA: condensation domain-containing protein, partial [Albitalea sp.]
TPQMLPLVSLTQPEIDRIVAQVPGGAANVQDIYPLAPLQEGILFHHRMERRGDVYLMPSLMGFDTRSRLDRFTAALQAVIDRHDVLRTGIVWEGLGEPVQVVCRRAALRVDEVALDPTDGDIAAQLRARFDPRHHRIEVGQAPLMHGIAACDAPQGRWLLLLLFHHLAMDHATLELLMLEIQAHLLGEQASLPKALPFRNVVAQARLGVPDSEHEAFFREMLAGVDEPTLPFGIADVNGNGSGVEEACRAIDAGLAQRLRQTARSLGVSAASLCHVAWARVLASISGRDDVVFGSVLLGRMHGGEGADRALGLFINTLPLRVRIDDGDVRENVRRVHALLGRLMHHEHASLALAQRCSGVLAPAPLFGALLNYRHGGAASDGPGSQAWEGVEQLASEERTNYPLLMSVNDLGVDLSLSAQACAPIDPGQVCELMHRALQELVQALEQSPTTPLRTLDVLPEAERRQLLVEWNATQAEYPSQACIHELIEAQVLRTPDAPAVVGVHTLTYAELNAQANRLARHLRRLGVRPDTRVGVCMRRDEQMVVALLAILKAGGAYVALDPDYPA